MKYYILITMTFLFIACGGGTLSEQEALQIESERLQSGKAQLGVLSKATVKLYEVYKGNKKLLATEITSSGDSIESIGNFNLHLEKIEEGKFYLHEIQGGEDFDVQDDGVIDENATKNKGTFHLLVEGKMLLKVKKLTVSIVSELVYDKVKNSLDEVNANLFEALDQASKELILIDINADGLIDMEDVLLYNPISNKENLQEPYKTNLNQYIENILNNRALSYLFDPDSVVKPQISPVEIETFENRNISTVLGTVSVLSQGDSNITSFKIQGDNKEFFEIDNQGNIITLVYLDYESYNFFKLSYIAINDAGESNPASLSIAIKNIIENSGNDYARTEKGIQLALDNGDYDFVLNQLFNNRDTYSGLNNDELNVNIAAAYVGKSTYTLYDIIGAMSNGSNNSFNGFINNITKNTNSAPSIENLGEADVYYSKVIQGLDCNNTAGLTDLQKDACVNLGLVRLTSLSNGVKLLFGGESTIVQQWADGVDVNSSDDLNGNGVIDDADAAACAIVYANTPNDNCKDGSIYSYRGRVTFSSGSTEYNLTILDVDVGSASYGYRTFIKLVTNRANNNSPVFTSGVCNKSFTITSTVADGINTFPCPSKDSNGALMELKDELEVAANIQALFPAGSETKTTAEGYMNNITGSPNGTVGLDNLSTYFLQN